MRDIFDLKEKDDLPENVLKNLKFKSEKEKANKREKFLALFNEAGRELSINEIIVGYYRMFGEELKRRRVIARLHYLVSLGVLRKKEGKTGIYFI